MSGAPETDPLSFVKWISGIGNMKTWAKALMFVLMAAIIIGLPCYVCYRLDQNGYTRGRASGIAEEQDKFRQYLKENPPIKTGDNATINNNVCKKSDHFGVQLKGCTFGMVCEK